MLRGVHNSSAKVLPNRFPSATTNLAMEIADIDMCLTAGEETKLGRGGTSEHQINSLTLEACNDALNDRQIWETRNLQ